MKYFFIVIVCIAMLSCKEKKVVSDCTRLNLHGKVKMLKEVEYRLDTTGANNCNTFRSTRITYFDTQGNYTDNISIGDKDDTTRVNFIYQSGQLVEEELFAPTLIFTTKYTYNASNDTKTQERINADGRPNGPLRVYKYSSNGILKELSNVFESNDKNQKPTIASTTTYTYDGNDKLIRSCYITIDSFNQTTTYAYDKQGNCISEISDTGKPHEPVKIMRQFDDHGNKTAETWYDSDGKIVSKKQQEYKGFDKVGNWLLQHAHVNNFGTMVTERVIAYYP